MKFTFRNQIYDTKSLSALGIESKMQNYYDPWLGVGKVRFNVALPEENVMEVTMWRQYGPWYEDPRRFPNSCNTTINSWDEQIVLAEDYLTGTGADFQTHTGRYIINNDVESIFLPKMKEMAKRCHGSRVKTVSVDNYLDHVTVRIELVKTKR